MEMVERISDHLDLGKGNPNEAVLKYIVPYIISFLKQEDRPLVRSRMIRALVYVLVNNVNGEFLDPIDYKIFPDYIMPSLFEKYFENEEELMDIDDEIIRYLGDIVVMDDSQRFHNMLLRALLYLKLGNIRDQSAKKHIIAEKYKYNVENSISLVLEESEKSGKPITAARRKQLERILDDEASSVQFIISKMFKRCNKSQNKTMLLEFMRNLRKIYFGVGKENFEKSLLPNLKDCILSGNTNILMELIKTIKILPLKSLNISSSMACYETIKNGGDLKSILPYINPIIRIFILSELEQDSKPTDSSTNPSSLCSQLDIEGISKMSVEDYEPFLKSEVSKETYDFFTTDVKTLANDKLNTIVFLFNLMMEDYKLNQEDISKIKNELDEIALLNSKLHIHVYNDLKLLKKKLHKMHFQDSVYDSKISKDHVSDFRSRKRALSNVNETHDTKAALDRVKISTAKAQSRGDLHYYPDTKLTPKDNFGLNSYDREELSMIENDKQRFT